MKLELNEKNEIISYLKCGGVDGINFTEFDGMVPDDFEKNFKPSFYMLKDELIIENPNYAEPEPPEVNPTNEQQILMQQAKTIAQMQQILMQQNKDIAKLKGANA
ncbi:DUF2977 domain-containing protein [Pediococcus acidilactici]|uniref:DUF2977 domain-containing protein n=1 Tax=Pediococcus acidilactici TaxID=1254 RepID=UPI00159C6A38|nr:DUF2977 domain-containing protein [Pediococcus acidilactici]NVM33683.1 DUF2977 domain-containing protein [Pediococcus acidilactici]